jgi:hypothetical protein
VVSRALGVPSLEPLPCVADWDAVSYTSTVPHCLRRVDRDLRFPADLNGEVHHDGQIWSRALWDIPPALGNVHADTVILEGSFDFPGTTMPGLRRPRDPLSQDARGASSSANAPRKSPTSVTTPTDWVEPRSASLVTEDRLMSTHTSGTEAGRRLPVAIEWSIEATIRA